MSLLSQKEKRIFLSPPHMSGNEEKYIKETFESNWIAPLGPNVDAFENQIAQYANMNGALAVSSGTAAIHLALRLLHVDKGDVVFCSSLTFIASANPIIYQGAEPVFIDSEEETWNMSPQALEQALLDAKKEGKLPKAVIVVNLYGQSAKMKDILKICNYYNIPIIEDAAESLGSTYMGEKSGTFGYFGIYSFNGNKIITTSGGGMLVSNDIKSLEHGKFLATQARDSTTYYQHTQIGFNYRMSNILAAIGRAQLEVLDERVMARRDIFIRYKEQLGDIPGLKFMPEMKGTMSNRWLTALTIDEQVTGVKSSEFIAALEEENIEARHLWKPLHIQPVFRSCKYYQDHSNQSVSEKLFKEGICLPSGSNMPVEDQYRVINKIQSLLK